MIFSILDFAFAAFAYLQLTALLGVCIYGIFRVLEGREEPGALIPLLVLGLGAASMLYEAIELHFCEKKKVEVACCVDGYYDRSGYQCTEMDYCEKEVCVD